MTSLVSSEFAALCQGQLRLLAQSTGASLGAVYIAEEWLGGENSGWLPVAIHPENSAAGFGGTGLLAPALEASDSSGTGQRWGADKEPRELAGSQKQDVDPSSAEEQLSQAETRQLAGEGLGAFLATRLRRWQRAMEKGPDEVLAASETAVERDWELDSGESRVGSLHQAMQPLLFDGRAVGMVVAVRERHDWQLDDHNQLEKVAQTLSTACAMERRLQWLQTRVHQQEIAQEKQQDIIDNLLHQFRNPLTALRTFGKLLVRRLSPEDRNQAVAAGIVRESDRLQGLLTQIGETVESFALPEAVIGELVAAPSSEQPRLAPGEQSSSSGRDRSGRESSAPQQPENGLTLMPQGELPALPAAQSDEVGELVSPLTGKPLVLGPHLVEDLIGERLPSWEAIAQVQGQLVMASLETGLPAVLADGDALGEVLSNLVDNGLKYGSPKGTVSIAVRSVSELLPESGAMTRAWTEPQELEAGSSETWQCIAISDDGPGIPEGDLPQLFERHYRGVQAEGSKPGTGLGLAIAKALVEQMGGRIVIQSPAGPFHPKVAFGLDEAWDPASHPGSAFLIWLKVAKL